MSQTFDEAMAAFAPALPLAVAFSGGADSTALLAACAARWPGEVYALHVHHGLQAAADDFERHCAALCAQLDVPLRKARIDAGHANGQSPEDAARRARYQALFALAGAAGAGPVIGSIALGHHADDQVETVLLALSRGAGLPGLSAMPARMERDGVVLYRPLLRVAAADIRGWLALHDLQWIDDPTNGDARFVRNRIRSELLPSLMQVFPQAGDTLARSAAHAAEAQVLLIELAEQDLSAVGAPPRIADLQRLSRARRANALRRWLTRDHGCAPSAAQLDELQRQIEACVNRGKGIAIKVGAGLLRREGEMLRWYNGPPSQRPLR